MRFFLRLSRVIVGVLFIFSGLIKANDPLGLSYKMQEFFEIWGWHALNDLSLALSIIMITFEILAGIAVLVGWRMQLFSWLLLLLTIFFTFLTGYAVFSGKIKECGCFGDCIPLTANQSFIKDLVLMIFILVIFAFRKQIRSRISSSLSMSILTLSLLATLGFQWYVLKYLPVVDCLPYKVGKNISLQMKIPEGSIPDSTEITFVYQKAGKEVEFTSTNFPADFDETTYTFVKRYDKVLRKGNAQIPIRDFALSTMSGTDTTEAVLTAPGYAGLIFTKGFDEGLSSWESDYSDLKSALDKQAIPAFLITNDYENINAWIAKHKALAGFPVLKCDFVAIKTAARANPTFYLLNQGTIVGKWSYANFDKAAAFVNALKK
jgi:uncharacterized membrane protein YphA (DoxX/SURF4 family)